MQGGCCPGGCPSSPRSLNILDFHCRSQEELVGSPGAGANLGARDPFWRDPGEPRRQPPAPPKTAAPAKPGSPPPSLVPFHQAWSSPPPITPTPLPLTAAAPHTGRGPKRLEKSLSGIPSPTHSPNWQRGEQRVRGREERAEREGNANVFYPPFLLNAETRLDSL